MTDRCRDWMINANCRGMEPDWFFPSLANMKTKRRLNAIAAAEALCVGCPVLLECGLYGLDESFGVWGGEFRDRVPSKPYDVNLFPKWPSRREREASA